MDRINVAQNGEAGTVFVKLNAIFAGLAGILDHW